MHLNDAAPGGTPPEHDVPYGGTGSTLVFVLFSLISSFLEGCWASWARLTLWEHHTGRPPGLQTVTAGSLHGPHLIHQYPHLRPGMDDTGVPSAVLGTPDAPGTGRDMNRPPGGCEGAGQREARWSRAQGQ